MKNFNKFGVGVHGKIRVLEGGFTKNQYIGGDCLKRVRGTWTVCRFKGELGKKVVGAGFEVGLIPQCTLWSSHLTFSICFLFLKGHCLYFLYLYFCHMFKGYFYIRILLYYYLIVFGATLSQSLLTFDQERIQKLVKHLKTELFAKIVND